MQSVLTIIKDADRRRKATDSGTCATPAAARPLRLGYLHDRQVVMAVRGAQLMYGTRRVSRRRFRVGVYRAFQPEFMDGRPRPSATRSGRAAPQPDARRRPMSFSAGQAFRYIVHLRI
jgi:hypothetical protein